MINEYQVAGEVHHTRIDKQKKFFSMRFIIVFIGLLLLISNLPYLFSLRRVAANINAIPFTAYNAKEGYSFSYPEEWKIGADSNSVTIVDNISSGNSSGTGVKVTWSVESNAMAAVAPVPQTYVNSEAQTASIISDEYTTIDGLSAFRLIKKIQPDPGDSSGTTKTEVSYKLLGDTITYKFNCEIDNNNPDDLISVCERIAKSFQFVK